MDISVERFAELIVAEHHYKRLCKIICEKADNYFSLDNQELRILRQFLCPQQPKEATKLGEE